MFKTMPRISIDLSKGEIGLILRSLVNPSNAVKSDKLFRFEQEFARFIGVAEACGFASARAGMYFSLKTLGLEPGDEVILPAYTFYTDPAIVVLAGLKPVFVDVDPFSFNIDASKIEEALSPKTKVIFLTHLNGLPADMGPILEIAKRAGIRVIEDCVRSCGARYKGRRVGSFDIGCFSFSTGKNFYTFGGGMVTSQDEGFMKKLRAFKQEFASVKGSRLFTQIPYGLALCFMMLPRLNTFTLFPIVYLNQVCGVGVFRRRFEVRPSIPQKVPDSYMVDMNNLQAELGLRQLERLDAHNEKRIKNAQILLEGLKGIKEIQLPPNPPDAEHIFVHFSVKTDHAEKLTHHLLRSGIDIQTDSCSNCANLSIFKEYGRDCPTSEELAPKVLFLPNHPILNEKDMERIVLRIREFFS